MFDYRVRHRGLANKSQTPRPLLYVTFAKKNYIDEVRTLTHHAARARFILRLTLMKAGERERQRAGC